MACGGGGGAPTGGTPQVPDTTRIVRGRIGYESRGPDLSNRDADGRLLPSVGIPAPTFSAPVAFALVEVLGDDGRILGQAPCDRNGRYEVTANYGQNPATAVRLRVTALAALPFGTHIRIFPNTSATSEYQHVSGLSDAPSSNRFEPLEADTDISRAEGAGAFHMLRVLWDSFVLGRSGTGAGSILPDLRVYWEEGNGEETTFVPEIDAGQLLVAGGLPGDDTSNTDNFDDPLLARMVGQYFFEYFFYEVAPDGVAGDGPLVPSAAWSEGFLDYFSCAARGSSIYWETEGSDANGRVTRFFDIESFFDASLGSLGANDPNVYQDASNVGIASRFSVAELLWDLSDENGPGTDGDQLQISTRLVLEVVDSFPAGRSYPYLFSLLDGLLVSQAVSTGTVNALLSFPENQGVLYPASIAAGTLWPVPFEDRRGVAIVAPFSQTRTDSIDTQTPTTSSDTLNDRAARYFTFETVLNTNTTLTLTTTGDLAIDILTRTNQVLTTGTSPLVINGLLPNQYIVRVRAADGAAPQIAPFDLTINVQAP